MSGPPANVSPSELWNRLSSSERPTKIVDFPRQDSEGNAIGQLALRVLTEAELMASRVAAEDYAKQMLKNVSIRESERSLGYETIYHQALIVEVLHRACRDLKEPRLAAFPTPKLMRDKFTVDELGVLMDAYTNWQLESGPIISHMTTAEMDAWIKRIGEAESAVPLAFLSSAAKTDLLMRLVSLHKNCGTGTTSAGAPPGTPSSTPVAEQSKSSSGETPRAEADTVPDRAEAD